MAAKGWAKSVMPGKQAARDRATIAKSTAGVGGGVEGGKEQDDGPEDMEITVPDGHAPGEPFECVPRSSLMFLAVEGCLFTATRPAGASAMPPSRGAGGEKLTCDADDRVARFVPGTTTPTDGGS